MARTVAYGDTIRIKGLNEVVKGLKAIDKDAAKTFTKAGRQLVNTKLRPAALGNLAGQPVPKVATSIATVAQQSRVGLKLRVSRFPWMAGAEFGSIRYRQFRSWTGNQYTGNATPGYVVGRALRDNREVILDAYADAMTDLFMEASDG